MKFTNPNCPTCGAPAIGVVDKVPTCTMIEMDKDGNAEYTGETKQYWEEIQTAETEAGLITMQCHDGHEWYSRDTEAETEPDDPALDIERGDGTTPRDDRAPVAEPSRADLLAFALDQDHTDAAYALRQLREIWRTEHTANQDCVQRALDALERIHERSSEDRPATATVAASRPVLKCSCGCENLICLQCDNQVQ